MDSKFSVLLTLIELAEAIISKHTLILGLDYTYQRGKILINRIFVSSQLSVCAARYYPIGDVSLDYRAA